MPMTVTPEQLQALLGGIAEQGPTAGPTLLAGARQRHRRRRATGIAASGTAIALVAVAAIALTADRGGSRAILEPAAQPTASSTAASTPATAVASSYAALDPATGDVELLSLDGGAPTVLVRATATTHPLDAALGPSGRYVYYVTATPPSSATTAWRVPVTGGDPQRLPSAPSMGAGPIIANTDDTEYVYDAGNDPAHNVYPTMTVLQKTAGGKPFTFDAADAQDQTFLPIGFADATTLLMLRGRDGHDGVLVGVTSTSLADGTSRPGADVVPAVGTACPQPLPGVAALTAAGDAVVATPGCSELTPPSLVTLSAAGANMATVRLPQTLAGYAVTGLTAVRDGRVLVQLGRPGCASTGAQPEYVVAGTAVTHLAGTPERCS